MLLAKITLKYKTLMWEPRRGVFYGPISPVYGIGAVVMVVFLVNNGKTPLITFLTAALLGGVVEYLISFLQEKVMGTTSWDYKNQILNINGRTTIPFMLFWGLLGLLFTNFLYPLISNFIESIPVNIGNNITNLILSFLLIDMFISWTALIRQNMRRKNISPYTKIGEICDQYYNDEYIDKKFPNMKITNGLLTKDR